MNYPHIAARLFNTPLLIHPQKLDAMIAGIGGRLLGQPANKIIHVGAEQTLSLSPELFSTRRGERADAGYRIVEGVAVLSINGALVHRSRLEADSTWLLGYNDLTAQLEDAMASPDVHAILQIYDSPGGEAQGAFEYAQRVRDMRGKKTLWAIADGMAASAAYLGASAADQLAITSTGVAGSIGVVARHVDFSRALDADGITITHIYAGAHKIDGNPYEPLPEAVRKDWQAEIDQLYAMFVDAVAQQRNLDPKAIRATQAATYAGQGAITAQLADRISTTDSLITELAAQRARSYPAGPTARTTAEKGAHMSGTTPGGTQPAASTTNPATQADLDAARAAGHQEGAQAERTRVSAILGHPKASANLAVATQCIQTGMTQDQANAVLGAMPEAAVAVLAATAQAPATDFAQHMARIGNPAVTGLEKPAPTPTDSAQALADSILAAAGLKH